MSEREEAWFIDSSSTAHECCSLLFFVGNSFLGESSIDPGDAPELGYRRGGVLFCCTTCGDLWARIVLVNANGKTAPFAEVSRVACEQHSDQWEVAGSILSGYRNEHYLKYLPEQALRREFEVHLRQMER